MTPHNPQLLSVLLVEDSPADVFLVKRALQEEGMRVHLEVADDGDIAFGVLDRVDASSETIPPSLLLLDVNLPCKSGAEVLERLRRSSRCAKIPVVMISSSDSPGDRQCAVDLGAEYFKKPSTLAEFMQLGKLVRRLLEPNRSMAAPGL